MHRLGACIALWSPLRSPCSVLSYDGMVTIGVVTDDYVFPRRASPWLGIASGCEASC